MELGALQTDNLMALANSKAQDSRLQAISDGVNNNIDKRADLEKAARQFEGVFMNTLLKAMRKTVPDNKLFNSGGTTKYYQQMYDQEIAKALSSSQGGMGVADMIIRQFESTLPKDEQNVDQAGKPGPVDQVKQSFVGPTLPDALSRYQAMSQVGERNAEMIRLKALASTQGTAVADTLARYNNEISSAADGADLDPALLLAVIMQESGGDPSAKSHQGAVGLMQLMPGTAKEVGVRNSYNPAENLAGGAKYLSRMIKRYEGRLDLGLAAYNAGPGTVDRAGKSIPNYPETQNYVRKVLDSYQELGGGTKLANAESADFSSAYNGDVR